MGTFLFVRFYVFLFIWTIWSFSLSILEFCGQPSQTKSLLFQFNCADFVLFRPGFVVARVLSSFQFFLQVSVLDVWIYDIISFYIHCSTFSLIQYKNTLKMFIWIFFSWKDVLDLTRGYYCSDKGCIISTVVKANMSIQCMSALSIHE